MQYHSISTDALRKRDETQATQRLSFWYTIEKLNLSSLFYLAMQIRDIKTTVTWEYFFYIYFCLVRCEKRLLDEHQLVTPVSEIYGRQVSSRLHETRMKIMVHFLQHSNRLCGIKDHYKKSVTECLMVSEYKSGSPNMCHVKYFLTCFTDPLYFRAIGNPELYTFWAQHSLTTSLSVIISIRHSTDNL